jgi:N-acetylneuraminic acid mutarotase/ribosomal 50S subunit-recycling heat shock protein
MKHWLPFLPTAVLLGLLGGCGGGGSSSPGAGTVAPPASVTYKVSAGVVQKGPLVSGSTVVIQELSASLAPTGKQYSYQTSSDFGAFDPSATAFTSQYIDIQATGYYFDETTGAVSTGTITLNAYVDLSDTTTANVNLLTTLAHARIQKLVANSGMSFAAAQTQAETEVLTALGIRNANGLGHFRVLDVSKGSDGDRALAAVSSLFSYGNAPATLANLIASAQNDIAANGTLTDPATSAALRASAQALNAANAAANLNAKYAATGLALSATDIDNWIDRDGDGLTGRVEFSVPDATQASTFILPARVIDPNAGASISLSTGRLTVNGVAISGAAQIQAGDVVTVAPPPTTFPAGVLTAYLMRGTARIARVSFISGLQSLAVTPAGSSLAVGLSQQFVATGTFTDSSTSNLASSVAWTSSATGVAAASATGSVTAVAVGTATITATSGVISGSTTMSVIPATLQSISISPDPLVVGPGISRQLTATGHYSDGSSGNLTSTATWSVTIPSRATVTGGLVTGIAVGTASVKAISGTIAGSAALQVTSNQWTAAGIPGEERRDHTATLLSNGKVFVAMGRPFAPCCAYASVVYDPLSNKWSGQTADFPLKIALHTATLLPAGKVFIAGGDDGATLDFSETYDPVADAWTPTARMAHTRSSHTATLLGTGKVLVAGGYSAEPGFTGVQTGAELYNPATNTWALAASMATARTKHTATLLADGTVLVIGGGGAGAGSPSLTEAAIYDPTLDSWTTAGNMANARQSHTAALLSNGKVVVIGGSSATAMNSVEMYDPATNTWTPLASMATARSGHTATVLPNGKILVAGGDSSNGQTRSTAEIYDPVANTWSATPDLLYLHQGHTATLLQNGAVLIVGGSASTQAELYW